MTTRQYDIKSFPQFDPEKDGCQEVDEYLGYKSSCFACPFPDCKRGYHRTLIKQARNAKIRRLVEQGMDPREAALKFKVSEMTIRRIMKKRLVGSLK